MPISTSLYTELRFTISDYLQRQDWARLYEVCGTDDDEAARTIGVIMSGYEPKSVWQFVDYAYGLDQDQRVQKPKSVATVCYILARMGQTNLKKTLSYLRQFLLENPALKGPVSVALSNMWVLSPSETSFSLLNDWILNSEGSDESLQDAAVESCEYLASNDLKKVSDFLEKISNLEGSRPAAKKARDLLRKYAHAPLKKKKKKKWKKLKKKEKKHKKKKHKGKKRKKRKKKKKKKK
jgi:hypothetical protein